MTKYYECVRCGYTTIQKARMRFHVDRTNTCSPTLNDVSVENNKEKILGGIIDIIKVKASIKCKYCNREFSRSDTCKRHENICKKREISKSDEKNTSFGYFYIFQLREHKNLNQNVYKIGKTERDIVQRFKEYPKGSMMVYSTLVNNCTKFETIIKNHFKTIFIHRTDCGEEYFEGDLFKILDELKKF
jgi:hypothetical protein